MPGLDSLMLRGHSQLPRKFPVSVLISLKSSYLTLPTILLLFPNQLCAPTVNQPVDDASCYRFREVSNEMQGASRGHQGIQLIPTRQVSKIDSCRFNGMGGA
jgi:hypothetical protein